MQDSLILQTTAYTRFEEFAKRLRSALGTVLSESQHDELGLVHRVGLRYIDVVRTTGGKDFRFYLRRGLHGLADDVYQVGHLRHIQSTGATEVGGIRGTMIVRVVQNDQGASLPPDLMAGAPELPASARVGELVTLIDMDHYIEGSFDADVELVIKRTFELHDHIIETLHDHVVTPEAIEEWK